MVFICVLLQLADGSVVHRRQGDKAGHEGVGAAKGGAHRDRAMSFLVTFSGKCGPAV
jgi:hypothetical protein